MPLVSTMGGGVNQGLKRGRESGDKWNQAESTDRLAGVARPCGNTEKYAGGVCRSRPSILFIFSALGFGLGLGFGRDEEAAEPGVEGLPSRPRVSSSLPRVEDEVAELNEPTVLCMFLARQRAGHLKD